MADIVLTTDELTVLGGPSSIFVDTNFGPAGERGSYILVGNGKPNDPSTVIGETPKVYDMYINVMSSDDEYMYIYQYLNVAGSLTWIRLMKLTPNTFSTNATVEFVDGSATIAIPIANIAPSYANILATLTADNFNIQATVTNQKAVASSISVAPIATDSVTGVQVLPITIHGAEFDSSATPKWVDLVGTKTVYLYITVV